MKKNILLLVGLTAIIISACNFVSEPKLVKEDTEAVDMHNSQNSLDWQGTYEGTLPCADCEGIKTTLQLNEDNTYALTQEYLGRNTFNETGTFNWDSSGSMITLSSNNMKFKVGENILFALDLEGKVITGELADHYKLKKTGE
ncbi:MAG: copper resistance protein NlpE N-terminal domain-containing protein [Chitinophagaceae bacterium]|nr:copper resistance protein NlpE N-terminal domain-containing protein [Chitinophagaceae bacterium]MCW5913884.1 copper resistance protein NlpE N-terminal domain-containing protein [Chitinophagaceae bacterium]MCZ2398004.1 copper resistance protein NlpE [Chitinophagales bacterium]